MRWTGPLISLLVVLNACDVAADSQPACEPCTVDHEGHACCAAAYDELYFCAPGPAGEAESGSCVQASGCEALDCCVPGEGGDEWCQASYGESACCVAGETDGSCSSTGC